MDWTFLVLSAGVVALAAVVIPFATTRNILVEVIVRTVLVGAGMLGLLYLEGPTWRLYRLLIGFLFGMSVWILLRRSDSDTGRPHRKP